ncbi:MAG: protein kinase [bacterium]|nr:protein kinase [bacterium]
MADEFIGKHIGGYEILDRLGVGGMATVYRARQSSMNRVVALKILPRHFMRDDTYLARFEREVKIVATLEHRNIVPVLDSGDYDGQPYIIMRYMPGGSVDDLLARGPLAIDQIVSIVEQIAPALDYAHSKGIIHRDLKPSNILMDDDGGAYITDFGIARILGSGAKGDTITTQGVVGTPSYMSPEQAQGHTLDGRSDVYSLGVMLFEMATGQRPFESDTPYSVAVMQVTQQPPFPRNLNPSLSSPVEQVILKALKKKPENRYQNAVELAEALRLAVERPGALLDTQPSNVREMQQDMGMTQPSGYMPREARPDPQPQVMLPQPVPYQVQSPPPQPPVYPNLPLVNTPSGRGIPVPTDSGVRRVPRRQPKRSAFWPSILVGGIIGCALLSLLVMAGAVVLGQLMNGDATEESAPTSSSGGSSFRPLDPTSEAARNQLIPGFRQDATAVYLNATPIPTPERTPEGEPTQLPTVPPEDAAAIGEGEAIRFVYFAERDGNFDLFLYNIENGTERQITENENADTYPMPSPDGQRFVFMSNRDGDFDIYLIGRDGTNLQRLTDNDVNDRLPTWSPDGEWIVWSSDTRGDGNHDLYRMQVGEDGTVGQVELLLTNGLRNSHARYSPDGRFLVFTSGDKDDATRWEIMTMEIESGELRTLTDNDMRDASPSFSPDGETIIYATDGEGRAAIANVPFAGGESRVIFDGPGYEWGMSYSPDGQFVLFNSEVDGEAVIFLMRADGSDVNALPTLGGFYPNWVVGDSEES